jgi:hypothetical protein
VSLSWSELVLILEGISLGSVRHRRRYSVDVYSGASDPHDPEL